MRKEECLKKAKELSYGWHIGDNEFVPLKDVNKLIREIYSIKPYKFEDLKAGMWVWCEKYDRCVQIVKTRIYEYDTGCFYKGQKLVRVYTNHDFGWDDIPFEENRFYPIHIAKRGVSDV